MDELVKIFYQLKEKVKTSENYVPRDYQTIGGMWTVDTYKIDRLIYQLMDEGYSERIFNDHFELYCNYNNEVTLNNGTLEDAKAAYELIK